VILKAKVSATWAALDEGFMLIAAMQNYRDQRVVSDFLRSLAVRKYPAAASIFRNSAPKQACFSRAGTGWLKPSSK
jgi:hypothetical protein